MQIYTQVLPNEHIILTDENGQKLWTFSSSKDSEYQNICNELYAVSVSEPEEYSDYDDGMQDLSCSSCTV